MSGVSRRDLLLAASFTSIFPWTWFRRKLKIAGTEFQTLRRGDDRRRFLWIHGNETSAREVLHSHLRRADGRAFLIRNEVRNIPLMGGELDPNRMFSRIGAEKNLRRLNPSWSETQVSGALSQLDKERPRFLERLLPRDGALLVALHNNGPGYSVKDEVEISDSVALNDAPHPDEFMLCTAKEDYIRLAQGSYNVLLQNTAPPEDDGSLSRLCAARGIRYVNIEAALGNSTGQQQMLEWLEKTLPA